MNPQTLLKEKRDQILAAAAQHGATNVRVFGSVARGEADEKSDIDILVTFEAGRRLLDHAALLVELEELLRSGERAWNLKRAYNNRLGLGRANDKLPRLLLEPLEDGGQAGHVPDMERLLSDYYAARGWNPATGRPLPEKLAALGLGFVMG